jgi:hypothetical protein
MTDSEAQPAGPELLHAGIYALYRTPSGGLHLTYRPEGQKADTHLPEVPPAAVAMLGQLMARPEGAPPPGLREMVGMMRALKGQPVITGPPSAPDPDPAGEQISMLWTIELDALEQAGATTEQAAAIAGARSEARRQGYPLDTLDDAGAAQLVGEMDGLAAGQQAAP